MKLAAEKAEIQSKKPIRRSWRFWLGGLLSLACLAWLVLTTDWAEAWSVLESTNYALVLLAAAVNLLAIPLRALRWQLLFPPSGRPPLARLAPVMLIGQAVNLLSPVRVGEVVQASLVESRHTAYVLGTLATRLALDLLMIAVFVVALLFQARLPGWWRGPGQAFLFTACLALLVMVCLVAGRHRLQGIIARLGRRWPGPRAGRILKMAEEFVRSLEDLARPGTLLAAVLLSAVIWMLYVLLNNIMFGAVGIPYSWLAAVFMLVVMLVGAAIPSSPGRLGLYHYIAVQALFVFGVDQATAVSYAILLHLVTVVLPVVVAALLAWRLGLSLTPKVREGL